MQKLLLPLKNELLMFQENDMYIITIQETPIALNNSIIQSIAQTREQVNAECAYEKNEYDDDGNLKLWLNDEEPVTCY